MKYVLEMKAAPGEDPTAPPATPDPMGGDTPPRWSGDLYEEGDETDPADSQWAFTGANGEQAWLDRSDDGTLVGWVRDADGSVVRYTDPDGWALDVDDAGMQRGDAPAEPVDEGAEVGAGEEDDPMGEPADDAELGDETDAEMSDDLEEEPTEPVEGFEDTATDFDDDGESPAEDDAEGDTDEEDAFKKRRFGNTEGKSRLRLVYTV